VVLAHDTERDIVAAAALVNTAARGEETLTDLGALEVFLDKHGFTGRRDRTAAELRQVRGLRLKLRAAWEAGDTQAVVALANGLLREADARPWLIDHDGWGWHIHVSELDAPLVDRLAAEAGMALADMIRSGELDRLRICAAEDCDAVLVDLTRNRSRIYCDTGNCGNRQHVAAYRARRKGEAR
jgi:predicted RNA-binding Zn ribbon-like protein